MTLESITASYSRKIQYEHYGGSKFEGSDHFCSMSASLDEGEDPTEAHRELMLACREMANTSASYDILKIQGGVQWQEFIAVLRSIRLGEGLDETVYNSWNELQKSIYNEFKKLARGKGDKMDKHHSLTEKS